MTLVDNGWERDRQDIVEQSGAAYENSYGTNTVRATRTAASFNSPYFDGRDIVAAAMASFMLLAPLAVTAFSSGS